MSTTSDSQPTAPPGRGRIPNFEYFQAHQKRLTKAALDCLGFMEAGSLENMELYPLPPLSYLHNCVSNGRYLDIHLPTAMSMLSDYLDTWQNAAGVPEDYHQLPQDTQRNLFSGWLNGVVQLPNDPDLTTKEGREQYLETIFLQRNSILHANTIVQVSNVVKNLFSDKHEALTAAEGSVSLPSEKLLNSLCDVDEATKIRVQRTAEILYNEIPERYLNDTMEYELNVIGPSPDYDLGFAWSSVGNWPSRARIIYEKSGKSKPEPDEALLLEELETTINPLFRRTARLVDQYLFSNTYGPSLIPNAGITSAGIIKDVIKEIHEQVESELKRRRIKKTGERQDISMQEATTLYLYIIDDLGMKRPTLDPLTDSFFGTDAGKVVWDGFRAFSGLRKGLSRKFTWWRQDIEDLEADVRAWAGISHTEKDALSSFKKQIDFDEEAFNEALKGGTRAALGNRQAKLLKKTAYALLDVDSRYGTNGNFFVFRKALQSRMEAKLGDSKTEESNPENSKSEDTKSASEPTNAEEVSTQVHAGRSQEEALVDMLDRLFGTLGDDENSWAEHVAGKAETGCYDAAESKKLQSSEPASTEDRENPEEVTKLEHYRIATTGLWKRRGGGNEVERGMGEVWTSVLRKNTIARRVWGWINGYLSFR